MVPPRDHDDLISLSEAARLSGYSMGHLRYLITHDRLEGWKLGRNYVTTREALAEYKMKGLKPGQKRMA